MRHKVLRKMPPLYWLYMKIPEPRFRRVLHFIIYICFTFAGLSLNINTPEAYINELGETLADVLGVFLALGGVVSTVAVLPGIWWLERVGLILLMTVALSYLVVLIQIQGTVVVFTITLAVLLNFIARWVEIRQHQLAPIMVSLDEDG